MFNKKYDLPRITPHHFRHTHASLLLQSGVPIKEVAERLGHTSTAITDRIYSHVMPEEKEKQRISSLNSSVLINAQTKAQTFTISMYKKELESL